MAARHQHSLHEAEHAVLAPMPAPGKATATNGMGCFIQPAVAYFKS